MTTLCARSGSVVCLLVSLVCSVAWASPSNYFDAREEGWFWYEAAPPPEEEPPPKKPDLPPPFETIPLPDFEGQAKQMIGELIEAPTLEKAVAYLAWQQAHLAKAERMAALFQQAYLLYPALNPSIADGFNPSALGHYTYQTAMAYKRTSALERHRDRLAILFFFSSTCPYCQAEISILDDLRRQGLYVRGVSLDAQPLPGWDGEWQADTGIARDLGVQVTPTFVGFDAITKQVALLGAGFSTTDEILGRLDHFMEYLTPSPAFLPRSPMGLTPPTKTLYDANASWKTTLPQAPPNPPDAPRVNIQ